MAVAQAQRIRDLAAGAAAQAGLVVEDVRLTAAGRRTVVRVTVDLPETETGGVPVDAVAAASRAVSTALDESDVMGRTPYVLEVSSPGVDRPLTERRHWSRSCGRLVTAQVVGGPEVSGRLTEVDDDGVVIAERRVPWSELGRGRVEIEFRREAEDDPDGSGTDDADDDDEAFGPVEGND